MRCSASLTDREVAEKLNRTLGAVRDRRHFLGRSAVGHATQPFYMEHEPRDRYARLFATKSNQELRAILGWSYRSGFTRRRQLAGGKVETANRNGRWKIACWGRSQTGAGKMFGRPVGAVRQRRGTKRIRLKKDWRPEDDKGARHAHGP